jgi:two-component system CheB/CheR fusion protein
VTDLSQANNDMNNLLAGTGIGTVFVDHQLRILRFTPAVARILNLIAADVGRPVGQIVSNLSGYTSLLSDTQAVLDNLTAREEEVRTVDGRWYAMRIQPYRTIDNVIEGAVITFADISEAVRTRNALRQTNELLRRAFVERDAIDAVSVQDLTGRILAWSRGAERTYGWSEAEALKMNFRDRIPDGLREEPLVMLRRISSADSLEPHRAQRITRDGSVIDVEAISVALLNASGEIYAYAMAERPQGKDQGVFAPLASQ